MTRPPDEFVSRAGAKLLAALDHFRIEPTGWTCADLGSNVGGFVDVLLRRGADRVFAVDTGYGTLDYALRRDPRVVVMERRNALYVDPPARCRLVTVDVGWTRQHHILPAAARWLDDAGTIVSLVKPHYEAPTEWLRNGVLPDDRVDEVLAEVTRRIVSLGFDVLGRCDSPVRGQGGNAEALLHVRPSTRAFGSPV